MASFIKDLFGGADKVTDILNLGRLIFYTAAGLPPILASAMILRMMGGEFDAAYWSQFGADFLACIRSIEVWVAALVVGFLVANLGYVRALSTLQSKPEDSEIDTSGFAYQYPRLRSGRVARGSGEADFDFAAWLIHEYYRYLEIAVYIPYGVLLSFPLLSLYSFVCVVRAANTPDRLDACFIGFGMWAAATAAGWSYGWRGYWLPNVATPIYRIYVQASAQIIQGVQDYNAGSAPESTSSSEKQK